MADNDRNRGRSAVLVVILVSYVMWRSLRVAVRLRRSRRASRQRAQALRCYVSGFDVGLSGGGESSGPSCFRGGPPASGAESSRAHSHTRTATPPSRSWSSERVRGWAPASIGSRPRTVYRRWRTTRAGSVYMWALPSLPAGGSTSLAFRSALLRSFVDRPGGANVGISGGPNTRIRRARPRGTRP
jgi:hypothetical protein